MTPPPYDRPDAPHVEHTVRGTALDDGKRLVKRRHETDAQMFHRHVNEDTAYCIFVLILVIAAMCLFGPHLAAWWVAWHGGMK